MSLNIVLNGNSILENAERLARHLDLDYKAISIPDGAPPEVLRDALSEADALITLELQQSAQHARRLRLLQVHAAGYDKIRFEHVPGHTAICRAGGHGRGIAEYVLMAMLAHGHNLIPIDRSLRSGSWKYRGLSYRPLRREFNGMTVGIVGYGEIGAEVARMSKLLGARTLACSRRETSDEYVDRYFDFARLDELLAAADFVVVCLPLAPGTANLFSAARLARMKRSGVLVNIARGAVVDEEALYSALRDGVIGGAVLDVWWNYPSDPNARVPASKFPFDALDNVLMTPHIAGWTEDIVERRWEMIARNIRNAVSGGPLEQLVRPADRACTGQNQ